MVHTVLQAGWPARQAGRLGGTGPSANEPPKGLLSAAGHSSKRGAKGSGNIHVVRPFASLYWQERVKA